MSDESPRRHTTDRAPARLSLMAVLGGDMVTVGLGNERRRRSPAATGAAGPPPGPAAGAVRFVKHTEPGFHRFTRDARHAHWMRRRFWRMTTYSQSGGC